MTLRLVHTLGTPGHGDLRSGRIASSASLIAMNHSSGGPPSLEVPGAGAVATRSSAKGVDVRAIRPRRCRPTSIGPPRDGAPHGCRRRAGLPHASPSSRYLREMSGRHCHPVTVRRSHT
jgi:hypothetical protein